MESKKVYYIFIVVNLLPTMVLFFLSTYLKELFPILSENCDSNFILVCNFYFVTVFWLKKVSRSYINDSIQFKFSQVFYEFF